jgi:WbqC-like protein
MKVAIMQPYFLPYIGYYQLIKAVDAFIFYDDVNYIKKGWINRNKIRLNNVDYLFTLPIRAASQNKKINETVLIDDNKWKHKLFTTIRNNYKKSNNYNKAIQLIEEILFYKEINLAKYVQNSLIVISKYLGLRQKFFVSSSLNYDKNTNGTDKILSICKAIGCTTYRNAIGGIDLYDKSLFQESNIQLQFVKPLDLKIDSFDFNPMNYSILELLFQESQAEISGHINNYEII